MSLYIVLVLQRSRIHCAPMEIGGRVLIMLVYHHVQPVITLLVLKDLQLVSMKRTTFIVLKEQSVARQHLLMKIMIPAVCELIGFIVLIGMYYLYENKLIVVTFTYRFLRVFDYPHYMGRYLS